MNDEYLDFAKELAYKAGKIMMRYFQANDIGTEWKEDDTPLTIADTKINELVIEEVKNNFPDHGVLGEEASFEPNRELVWVVDPIDGTVPFSLGMPLSTFSLGLVDKTDGQSLIGVVYDPQLKNMYFAAKGKGAFLNNRKLKASAVTEFDHHYVSVLGGRPRDKSLYFEPGRCTDILRADGANVMSLISQVYVAVKVATGELVGSIFGYGEPWDSAAASLIVQEAGGIVTDLEGKKRRYDQSGLGCVLSADKEIHAKLLKAIQESKVENHRN